MFQDTAMLIWGRVGRSQEQGLLWCLAGEAWIPARWHPKEGVMLVSWTSTLAWSKRPYLSLTALSSCRNKETHWPEALLCLNWNTMWQFNALQLLPVEFTPGGALMSLEYLMWQPLPSRGCIPPFGKGPVLASAPAQKSRAHHSGFC